MRHESAARESCIYFAETARLLDKLKEMEALQGDQRLPSQGLLSKFRRGLAEFLRDFVRIFAFHLVADLSSFVFQLALAIYAGVIVALLFQWPAIYPVATTCLATILLRLWVRNAKKRRDS